ncbi:MAG: hypothetical protein AAFO94_12200 [Bacteroidota bacterium]
MNVSTLPVAGLIAAALSLTSCDSSIVFQQPKTDSGYDYFHHVNNGGEKPESGDYAYCYIDMRNGERLVNTNRNSGKLAKLKIADLPEGVKISPVVDALKLMSIGDSLTVNYPIASLQDKPKGFETADFIYYDIKLIDIKSDSEYKADFKARWKKATASLN